MKKKNLILFSIFGSIATVALPVLSLKCEKTKDKIEPVWNVAPKAKWYTTDFSNYHEVGREFDKTFETTVFDRKNATRVKKTINYWQKFSYVDGEVVSMADGDTITVKAETDSWSYEWQTPAFKVGQLLKVRIESIDTLEENVPNVQVDPEEKKWAQRDHEFAAKLLPIGSKVRLAFANVSNMTYDRVVAHVFFGENYWRNFSVEMLAGAVTLARIGETEIASYEANYNENIKESPSSILLPYLAYAFNEGISEKKGFYNPSNDEYFESPAEFSKMYKAHGEMLPQSLYILDPALAPKGYTVSSRNIYHFIKSKTTTNSDK
ncbi:Uncharacterised protein [Metamycoplasma cloacale]|uniref:Uncharacterized protein n=1 Tax=Metamycoplasma cloacale TaxID=92401 RepID=A0A2Z4LNP1_9BACT|nr:thermonuclease family protein [Metamycoplasma cloacale]AWX42877.1 hypothetical protein DK849_02285 [Metamycoplasma cloacale]VEU79299.1 Uncharacterised protein [Metamycoplasma cloacale]